MKALQDLKEMLEDEIKKITKKGDITPQELDSMYKATDIIKDIETIDAMKEYGEDEQMQEGKYSQRGGSYRSGNRGGYSQDDEYSQRYGMMMPRYMPYAYGPVWNQDMQNQQEMQMQGQSNNYSQRGSYNNSNNYGGNSNNYSGNYSETYSNARQGRDGDGDGQYSEAGESYRRGRDARTGRYVSRDGGSYEGSYGSYRRGYSRHAEKERMIEKLETMMDTVSSERERQAIMKCIDELQD